MASAKRGMGRGLSAILPSSPAEGEDYREVPVAMIKPNPNQPRTRFEPEALRGLADSIAAAGVVQPLLVRPLADGSYELIAGERRWRAAQQAGIEKVPAIIRDEDEAKRLQTALVENMVREDLNPVDEARACAALVEDLGLSKEELARRVGRSRAAISNLVRLLDLPDPVLELLESGGLSEGHGRAVLQAKGNEARLALAREALRRGWSVRETEQRAKANAKQATKRRPRGLSADEKAAIVEVEDTLSAALGADVRVRSNAGKVKAELQFDDLDELRALVRRLTRRR
jgi:ParB family transcriptional regulator, chromosome partitioning protein